MGEQGSLRESSSASSASWPAGQIAQKQWEQEDALKREGGSLRRKERLLRARESSCCVDLR
jgi:hypothetical protein